MKELKHYIWIVSFACGGSTSAYQAPLSYGASAMGILLLPFPYLKAFLTSGIESSSLLHWQLDSFNTVPPGKPISPFSLNSIVVLYKWVSLPWEETGATVSQKPRGTPSAFSYCRGSAGSAGSQHIWVSFFLTIMVIPNNEWPVVLNVWVKDWQDSCCYFLKNQFSL